MNTTATLEVNDDIAKTKRPSVLARLQKIRVELAEMKIKKTGYNPYSKFEYYELSDFLPIVQKMMRDNDLCPVVQFTTDEAELIIYDSSGELTEDSSVRFISPNGEVNLSACHGMQNEGARQTYQRRYLYIAALEIVEPEALDPTAGKDKDKTKPEPLWPKIEKLIADNPELKNILHEKKAKKPEIIKAYTDFSGDPALIAAHFIGGQK